MKNLFFEERYHNLSRIKGAFNHYAADFTKKLGLIFLYLIRLRIVTHLKVFQGS